ECLEVGLDARPAAGVRTRDGDSDRGHVPARLASAASTTRKMSSAAAVGLGASDSAEITDTPSAPASITGAALPALMPAMPQVGNPGFRRCSASITFAMPAIPIGEFLVTFEVVPYTPPMPA